MRTETDYVPFYRLNKTNFLQEMGRLMKAPGFDSKDLDTAKNIMSELDTPDRKLRAEMLKRLKDIYVTNYHKVKSQKTSRGVKIIRSEDPPIKEKDKKR